MEVLITLFVNPGVLFVFTLGISVLLLLGFARLLKRQQNRPLGADQENLKFTRKK
ncbi:MAG: hypothetical protein H6546_08420 [Chitinophagales bacterium]|nr:hypothetical protein [Chitinophagales bacterium]HQU77104.1 hypothetical protein [Chitinophagales bacterium]